MTSERTRQVRALFLARSALLTLALVLGACNERTHDRQAASSRERVGSIMLPGFASDGSPLHDPRVASLPLLEGPFDEVWVLSVEDSGRRAHTTSRRATRGTSWRSVTPAAAATDLPRAAALLAEFPCDGDAGSDEPRRIPLPLMRTEIDGRVDGPIVSATMRQRYRNPFTENIDAVYVFPLPHDAAVSDFVMVIGERRIRGLIRERGEAERTYAAARRAGHVAALLTEERPNIFTQRVANIAPGREIDVEIAFFGTVAYDDGWHELAIPLVVGPRFTPGDFAPPPGRAVVARPRTAPAEGADRNEVRYLAPGETSDNRVSMRWTIDAGTEIRELSSPTHRIATEHNGSTKATITLSAEDGLPDRDFVLRWRVGADTPTTSIVSSGQHMVLTIYPPAREAEGPRVPLETVIVIDRSGSMGGPGLAQAKEIARTILAALDPNDTFTIVEFSQTARPFSDQPLPATRGNVERGRRFVDDLQAGGGTHMLTGLRSALSMPGDESRLRQVILLTDGYIGNETQVLSAVSGLRGNARISAIGTGGAVNRFLIDAMAQIGDGIAGTLLPHESARASADALLDRLRHPLLAAPSIDFGAVAVGDPYPHALPDLRPGRPITVIAKTTHRGPATIALEGWRGDQRIRVPIDVDFRGDADGTALDRLWARAQIAGYTQDAWRGAISDAPDRIRTTALAHGLLSAYTAFIAVDASETVPGGRGTIVQQAVPVPDGVDHDSTVGRASGPR